MYQPENKPTYNPITTPFQRSAGNARFAVEMCKKTCRKVAKYFWTGDRWTGHIVLPGGTEGIHGLEKPEDTRT